MEDVPNLDLYLQIFRGREDYFAQQGEDWYFPVPNSLDEFYVRRHLDGDATFGVYVLNCESCCHLVCIDIDIPKGDLGTVDFSNPTVKYGFLKEKLDAVLKALSGPLAVPPESILLEETGGRGYHIWVPFSGPVPGQTAVRFGEVLKAHLDFEIEFFPKQGLLTPNRKFGNLIKLPLGLHRKYGCRSSFFYSSSEGLHAINGLAANLAHLRAIVPIAPEVLNRCTLILSKELPLQANAPTSIMRPDRERLYFEGDSTTLLTQCTAMRNLSAKAMGGGRFSHSEAFLFADVMLSVPGGVQIIHDTMRRSLAADYDHTRTQSEIQRIEPLLAPSCATLMKRGVCPAYCKDSVRKRNEDPLAFGTTPCSVWLRSLPKNPIVRTEDIVERIGTAENLKRAFFQLRQYHEHEDALFFDPFDFEHFEGNLEANCEVLARALLGRSEVPFAGYMPVALPKKINEAQELEYRTMSYSTVYDQVPLQAIFNVVAPIVEREFQSTSFGYRWNTDIGSPYRIFEDWKGTYPKFRNAIMAALKQHPNGFHVCCDIKGYYDHVDHGILLEQIRRVVPDSYIYQLIAHAVRAYSIATEKGCGLPQGPAYARLLANLYLNELDVFSGRVAEAYFRYVDDFVLIFESREDAERGLESLVRRLADLGLELSQDESKQAVIEPNTDISRILKTLDKIHYGIIEGTRHVEHLAPKAVADFMDAVKRHSVSPVTIEELIRINDMLPSLLYIIRQESLFAPQLKPTILGIIKFLMQHRWFCPKNLKTIFYRLLDLESDEVRLREFFLLMEPTHKVYFLLSVYGCWQSRGEHRDLLERLVRDGLGTDSIYVWGFATAIAAKLDIFNDVTPERIAWIQKLQESDRLFGLAKWLLTIDYLAQSDDTRVGIRELVGPRSPVLVRMHLLSKLTHLPTIYKDSVYLSGLMEESGVMLLPAACNLLVAAADKGELFDSLIRFVLSRLAFKPLLISFVAKGIFDKRAASGRVEIENLMALYECVPDDELKRCMLGTLSRIVHYARGSDGEFLKLHKEIARYNECFLFERVAEKGSYDYLELIPEGMLRDKLHCDLDRFRSMMEDFGAKEVLPDSNIQYDSTQREVSLEFKTNRNYLVLDPSEFALAPDSALRACILAAELYRKACYFRRITGKAPHISPDNLLVDSLTGSVRFRTIGRSLCDQHIFAGTAIGDQDSDIAKMLSVLLDALMFKSRSDSTAFCQQTTHQGVFAFLSLFIKNLRAKDPGHRYSCSRFEYLVDQLRRASEFGMPEDSLNIVYLREQLKGALFRFNSEMTNWHGVCRALNEHISNHIRAVYSREMLRALPFRSRLMFSGRGTRQLHEVTRFLRELALSREDFREAEKDNSAYLDLVEFLLLYASICLEIVALGRTLRNTPALHALSSSPLIKGDRVRVIAGRYEADVAAEDLAALVMWQPKEKTDEATAGMSLRQLSLQALFACGIEMDGSIRVKKPATLRDDVFLSLAHACLVRIPSIENAAEEQVKRVLLALQSNEDLSKSEGLGEVRDAVAILAQDLKLARSGLHLSRHRGRADGRYFPPDIRCRGLFHRPHRVQQDALPFCALTNTFPSSGAGYVCSWDLNGSLVPNLMIPSEGLNSLMQDLKKGKPFGFKPSYLYSGKAMLLWDGALFLIFAVSFGFFDVMRGTTSATAGAQATYAVLAKVLSVPLLAFFSKLMLYDLGYCVPWHRQITRFIVQQFRSKQEPP
jgi:hypothetical protein